jgi:CelD/BcsL family acetyltransferase involved in cellulose biosynthesis
LTISGLSKALSEHADGAVRPGGDLGENRSGLLTEGTALWICAQDQPRWTRFIASHSDATMFHHPAWSSLMAECYGFQPLALVQTGQDGEVVAGLPILSRPAIGGQVMISLPFTDYCPPLLKSPKDAKRFTATLIRWRRRPGIRRLAIHSGLPAMAGVHTMMRGVRHTLPLPASSDEIFRDLRQSSLPRAIRKAQREGVRTVVTNSHDALRPFYDLHVRTRQRLGVPVQPKGFFEILWRRVIEERLGFVVLAYLEDRPIAAAVFLAWNQHLIYKYGASDPHFWALRPNNLAMWTGIEWGCAHGFTELDFGRSDLENQGLREFKSRWGATELPLAYSYVAGKPPRAIPRFALRAIAGLIRSSPPAVCRGLGEVLYRRMAGAMV